jgi:hypothetical protein
MHLKFTSFLLFTIIASVTGLYGQSYRLSGIVMDKNDKTPLIGAIVILKEKTDTTKQNTTDGLYLTHFVITPIFYLFRI